MPIRLVLADDHPLIIDGLDNLFRLGQEFEVVARCRDGEETLQAVRWHRPDVLILDIRMPVKDGLEVLREMKEEGLPTRVVLLTAALDEKEVIEAIRLGVHGVVLKEMAPQVLIQCIRKVQAGERWIEQDSAGRALEKMLRREAGSNEIGRVLFQRETAIVQMVGVGLRNREIADRLFISEGTVKVHLHNIYEKLDVDGRLALLRYAREKGLV